MHDKANEPKEVCIDLGDCSFFANLSWSLAVDYLNQMPAKSQKKYLGMQSGCSDVIWRYYKK